MHPVTSPNLTTELLALPASTSQLHLWSVDQANPGDSSLNIAFRFALTGPLDTSVLEQAFNEIIQRHEILRSSFTLVDAQLTQLVAPSLSLLIPVYDLREMPEHRRVEEAERLAASEAYQSFSLSSGPLVRARLIRCDEREHVLLLTLHRIICDTWSLDILVAELGLLYEVFLAGCPNLLPDPEIQYADYTLWQQESPSERAHRSGPLAAISGQADVLSRLLPSDYRDRIREFNHRHNTTRSMLMLGTLSTLLHHYTGESSIVLATPATGRDGLQIERLIGPFEHTRVVHSNTSGDPTFLELLSRTGPINHNRPVQAHLAGHYLDLVRPWSSGGLRLRPLPAKSSRATYALNFALSARALAEQDEVYVLSCEYTIETYDAETIHALLACFTLLLDAVMADPTRRLSEYQVPLPNRRGLRPAGLPELEVPLRDRLEAKLTAIWESILGKSPIGRDEDFFEIGGHLVLAARMFAQIEEVLGRSLPVAALFQSPTIAKLATLLREAPISSSTLVPVRLGGSHSPFFFLHPAGSNALAFAGFASHFRPEQTLYGLEAPGVATIEEMAAVCIGEIKRVQARGPYHLGGFLSGGIVAFEMARKLRALGESVGMLALVNTRIEFPSPVLLKKLSDWMWKTRHALGMSPGKLAPEEVFLLALHRYTPQPYDGGALLFRVESDLPLRPDPTLGWGQVIRGDLQVDTVSGEEERLLDEPNIGRLARVMSNFLLSAYREEGAVPKRIEYSPPQHMASVLAQR